MSSHMFSNNVHSVNAKVILYEHADKEKETLTWFVCQVRRYCYSALWQSDNWLRSGWAPNGLVTLKDIDRWAATWNGSRLSERACSRYIGSE